MDNPDVATRERRAADATPVAPAGWAARLRAFVRPRGRWCWGTRLVVVASIGWLLFVVAHRLLSGHAWWWAPFDLMPPFLFLAVPVALLVVAPLARPVRWRIMAVLAVTVLLGAAPSGINWAGLWHRPTPAPPGAVTVVSWNTEFWDQDWRTARGTKYEAGFYDFLRGLHADVYLLKEYLYVNLAKGTLGKQAWTADMALRIDKLPQLRRAFPGYQVAISGDQITLSRFPIVGQRGLDMRPWLPADQKPVPAELRTWPAEYTTETLRTDIRLNGRVVSFYNTQIAQPPVNWRLYQAAARGEDRYYQARRAASFRALTADVAGNHNPVVIGADLNTTPAMGVRRLLPKGLVDGIQAESALYPTTWRAGGLLDLWRIDWLLTTKNIGVHRYDLLGADGLSDHKPQRAVLSVQN